MNEFKPSDFVQEDGKNASKVSPRVPGRIWGTRRGVWSLEWRASHHTQRESGGPFS